MSEYKVLNEHHVKIGDTGFLPWPNFMITGHRVEVSERLFELLTSNEIIPLLWRAKIPVELLRRILSFPKPEFERLLDLSQLDYHRVMDWADFCPALLVLVSSWRKEDPLSCLEAIGDIRAGWRKVLKAANWPASRSTLKILRKLPTPLCCHANLGTLRCAFRSPKKKRCLRHLRAINTSALDLLTLSDRLFNSSLFEKASQTPETPCNLSEVCEEIKALRSERGVSPSWPFTSGDLSPDQVVQHLVKLERRVAVELNEAQMVLPAPPLDGMHARNFQIEPLTTIREIFWEGSKMNNCLASYIRHITKGSHYAYRLTKPERATVLMLRREDEWYPVQIKVRNNQKPKKETVYAVHVFTGTIPVKLENIDYDYPF
jgi:DNA-binding transcriptional ArsR family regulator